LQVFASSIPLSIITILVNFVFYNEQGSQT
jgi:hypothetical protein